VRVSLRSISLAAGLATSLGLAATALAGGNVNVIVLKEHAVGSSSAAQPYLVKLLAITAQENGWASGNGEFDTKRDAGEKYIESNKPNYGIISLPSFLAFKGKYNVDAIGEATVATGGGQQYFLISKTASDLAGCKGKRLASDHIDDPRFIEKIVADGKFKLSEFTLDQTTRPSQAARKVVSGDAECALIDDSQLAELPKMNDPAVKQVWASNKLPSMIVVAFPSAPAAERATFQSSLPKICTGGSAQVCKDVGLLSLSGTVPANLPALIKAY
jgi:hypothetical protein